MASLAVLILLCANAAVVVGQVKLVIDHDGGADDAMAIFEALNCEQYFNGPQVLALTTTHGNVPEVQAYLNSQRILGVADRRDVPIYRGSNFSLVIDEASDGFFGRDGLGDAPRPILHIPAQPGPAALGLVDLTLRHPGQISLVALGSMTNIALAIRLDPGFLSRLYMLYVAVGNETQYPKFNIYQDVEAYHVIAQAARPDKVTIFYFEKELNVTAEWRKNVLGRLRTRKIQAQNTFERISLNSEEQKVSWTLLDPAVMAAVLNPYIVREVKYANNCVILCGAGHSTIYVHRYKYMPVPQVDVVVGDVRGEHRGLLTNNITTYNNANVKVIRGIDDNKYKAVLYSIFAVEAH